MNREFLPDTHAILWFLDGDPRLSVHARSLMEDKGNSLFCSIASLWEIAIKVNLGKLPLNRPFQDIFPAKLEANSIEILPIRVAHLYQLAALPHHHRDPFDRLLLAQSLSENLTLLSADSAFDAYGVAREW